MKQIWISIFFCAILLGITHTSVAQIIKGEAILGLNMTQVEGDKVFGFKKPGLNIGVGAMIPFANKWDVSMEVTYNQKGSSQKDQYNDVDSAGNVTTGAYRLRLNYVEVPVLVHFTDKEFLTIGAGFSWGRLVGVQEWEHGKRMNNTTLNSGIYDKNDFSYIIDLRVKIKGPLKLSFRYQNSMKKIRTRTFDISGGTETRDQFNKVLTFRLVYMFNENLSKVNRSKPIE